MCEKDWEMPRILALSLKKSPKSRLRRGNGPKSRLRAPNRSWTIYFFASEMGRFRTNLKKLPGKVAFLCEKLVRGLSSAPRGAACLFLGVVFSLRGLRFALGRPLTLEVRGATCANRTWNESPPFLREGEAWYGDAPAWTHDNKGTFHTFLP